MSLTNSTTDEWTAYIPQQQTGEEVYYYIAATAIDGKTMNRPMPAPDGYWKFAIDINSGIDEKKLVDVGKIYPNPSKHQSKVNIFVKGRRAVIVELRNILDQNYRTLFNSSISGQKDIYIQTSDLSSGLYIVAISVDDQIFYRNLSVY